MNLKGRLSRLRKVGKGNGGNDIIIPTNACYRECGDWNPDQPDHVEFN